MKKSYYPLGMDIEIKKRKVLYATKKKSNNLFVGLCILSFQYNSYSSYESFFQGPENWGAHSGSLTNCTSSILRYNSSTAKSVTFTTDCEFDAYLYVIDPRSTDAISSSSSSASVYNDDGAGSLQAKITKQLDANVPYLVILTAYNPSTQSGDYTINFS